MIPLIEVKSQSLDICKMRQTYYIMERHTHKYSCQRQNHRTVQQGQQRSRKVINIALAIFKPISAVFSIHSSSCSAYLISDLQ